MYILVIASFHTDYHCHYKYGLLNGGFVILPVIAGLVTVVLCNMYSWVNLMVMMRAYLTNNRSDDNSSESPLEGLASSCTCKEFFRVYYRLDNHTRGTICRMIITPILYILILIVMIVSFVSKLPTYNIVDFTCIITAPAISLSLWIVTDKEALSRLQYFATHGSYPVVIEDSLSMESDHIIRNSFSSMKLAVPNPNPRPLRQNLL